MRENEKMEEYREYLVQRELSENTIRIYVRQAELLLRHLNGKAVTKTVILEYKKYLLGQKKKASSTNLYITAINSYLKYAGREECTVRTERVQRNRSLENVLSIEEYHKILSYAKESGREKYYYIIRTLAFTGMRVGELAFLTVEVLERGVFPVENKGKTREIYLPDRLVKELTAYCRENEITTGSIFRGNGGKPIHRVAVYRMLIKLADLTGVEKRKAHPHSYRHLFALTYMKKYADITELADLLGHSSLETTRIYTTTTAEEKRKKLGTLGF